MSFVSMLAIALLTSFGTNFISLGHTFDDYLHEYGEVDELVSTGFVQRDTFDDITDVEGVSKADKRLTIDAYLKKEDRAIVTRLFSYNENQNEIFKRYILEGGKKHATRINVSVCRKFALNNNFKIGDLLQIGYFGVYIDCNIYEIIETSEGIYPRANDYVWSDNQDFGYIYINEQELDDALIRMGKLVNAMIAIDPTYGDTYQEMLAIFGITMPDVIEILNNNLAFASKYANQVIVQNKSGYTQQEVMDNIDNYLNDKGITKKSSSLGVNLPYRQYMASAIRQVNIVSVFLPTFFYAVMMIVVGLFMSQIIKTMTPEIGVLMSIGVGKKNIVSLYLLFVLLMAIVAGVGGSFLGYGLSVMFTGVMVKTYSIPVISAALNPWVIGFSIGLLVVFAELATLISCINIFSITPKDAVISNEAKRKRIPRWAEKLIEKSPISIKLSVNSFFQNTKKYFVSTFSMFASMLIIILSFSFYVSKTEMIDQSTTRRLKFDVQVYLTEKADPSFLENMKNQEFVTDAAECYYTYIQVNGDKYVECLAIDDDAKELVGVPSSDGYGTIEIPESGIVLPKGFAEGLKVTVGDSITINNVSIKVADISYQYFHPIAFLQKTEMDRLGVSYVSSYLVDITDDTLFLDYISEQNEQALSVFTKSLVKDLKAVFDAIDIFIYIFAGFSLMMSYIILTIMSQNSLIESKRQVSILRAIGFRVLDISNIWTAQSFMEYISAMIIGVPGGILMSTLLFAAVSSATQTYPFVFSWGVIGLAVGFVLAVVIITHLLAMISIKKWNLADNTRCRE